MPVTTIRNSLSLKQRPLLQTKSLSNQKGPLLKQTKSLSNQKQEDKKSFNILTKKQDTHLKKIQNSLRGKDNTRSFSELDKDEQKRFIEQYSIYIKEYIYTLDEWFKTLTQKERDEAGKECATLYEKLIKEQKFSPDDKEDIFLKYCSVEILAALTNTYVRETYLSVLSLDESLDKAEDLLLKPGGGKGGGTITVRRNGQVEQIDDWMFDPRTDERLDVVLHNPNAVNNDPNIANMNRRDVEQESDMYLNCGVSAINMPIFAPPEGETRIGKLWRHMYYGVTAAEQWQDGVERYYLAVSEGAINNIDVTNAKNRKKTQLLRGYWCPDGACKEYGTLFGATCIGSLACMTGPGFMLEASENSVWNYGWNKFWGRGTSTTVTIMGNVVNGIYNIDPNYFIMSIGLSSVVVMCAMYKGARSVNVFSTEESMGRSEYCQFLKRDATNTTSKGLNTLGRMVTTGASAVVKSGIIGAVGGPKGVAVNAGLSAVLAAYEATTNEKQHKETQQPQNDTVTTFQPNDCKDIAREFTQSVRHAGGGMAAEDITSSESSVRNRKQSVTQGSQQVLKLIKKQNDTKKKGGRYTKKKGGRYTKKSRKS